MSKFAPSALDTKRSLSSTHKSTILTPSIDGRPNHAASSKPGFKMIELFDVENFRCFAHLKLHSLRRINVVTGSNASGKSALLEALYLGANATAAALQNINASRSQVTSPPMPMVISPNGVLTIAQPQNIAMGFDHLFRTSRIVSDTQLQLNDHRTSNFETAKKIEIQFSDSNQVKHTLGIAYQGSVGNPVPVARRPGGMAMSIPLMLDRHRISPLGTDEHTVVPVTVNQLGQLQQVPAAPFGPATLIFGPGMDYSEVDDVTWFSQLKERNQAEMVISFIREEFPFVTDIEVLAPAGVTGLYAILSDGTTRQVTSISSGIYKIVSILLACAHTTNGIILIDEIENGIFYEKYNAVWRVLYKFADETKNQIFVSSHSAECLKELVPIIDGKENEFGLLRTERRNGECVVDQISGAAMKAALKRAGEIRGTTVESAEAYN